MSERSLTSKGRKSREEILSMARKLFLGRGYHKTSLQDILSGLGLSKGSFYHHFDSKQEVLSEITALDARSAYRQYSDRSLGTSVEQIDRLLYHASPFGPSNQLFRTSYLELAPLPEAGVLVHAYIKASREAFLAAFCQLLLANRQEGHAMFLNHFDLDLAFDAFLWGSLMICQKGQTIHQLIGRLQALRRLMEAQLGLVPGSLLIIDIKTLAASLGSENPAFSDASRANLP